MCCSDFQLNQLTVVRYSITQEVVRPSLLTAFFYVIGSQAIRCEMRYPQVVNVKRKLVIGSAIFLTAISLLLIPVSLSVSGFYNNRFCSITFCNMMPSDAWIKYGSCREFLQSKFCSFTVKLTANRTDCKYHMLYDLIASFLFTDAFNIMSLDSVNNYYRSVWNHQRHSKYQIYIQSELTPPLPTAAGKVWSRLVYV